MRLAFLAMLAVLGLAGIAGAAEVSMAFTWSEASSTAVAATSFRIYRQANCAGPYILDKELTFTIPIQGGTYQHVAQGLTAGKKYCWRAHAVGQLLGVDLESGPSNILMVTVPMPPSPVGNLRALPSAR